MTPRLALGLAAVVLAVAAGVTAVVEDDEEAAPATATVSGEVVFRAKGCASCHDSAVGQSTFDVGPDLRQLATVGSRVDGLDLEAYVRQSVRTPQAFVVPGFAGDDGGSEMPTLDVSDQELDALVALLVGRS